MNKFIKSGSKLFIFASCLFIFTIFIDQANLLDIFLGNNNNIDIEHPAEVKETLVNSPAIFNHVNYNTCRFSPDAKVKQQRNSKVPAKRIIIDEDSPSTVAIPFDVSVLGQSITDKNSTDYSFVTITKSLYLYNKTLLI